MRGDGGMYHEKLKSGETWDFVFDTRRVFAFQLIAAMIAVLIFILLNGASTASDISDIANQI
jgi:hypothetical protein